jgi:hypothetical protein
MNPSSNAQPKIAEMYPGIYQPHGQISDEGGPDLPMQPLNTLLGFDLTRCRWTTCCPAKRSWTAP